jgi:uncharacterized protein (DUF433 family)/DNA-binding transcriptional MerR regulator
LCDGGKVFRKFAVSKTLQHVEPKLLGIGLYTATEASRLTRIPAARIDRWLRGYRRGSVQSLPLWSPGLPQFGQSLEIDFLDLVELRFVKAFLDYGLSLQRIRLALHRAREMFDVDHPFCTQRFKTDGRAIFLEVQKETGDEALIDLIRNQYAFSTVVAPSLQGLVFDADQVVRWHPWPLRNSIVIDPTRSFGAPMMSKENVPTRALMTAFVLSKSYKSVANDFILSERSVRDAVAFEEQLAA